MMAFLLLGLGQCGYDRIKTLQTLENAEADVVSEYPAVDVIRPAEVRLHQSGGQAVLLVDALQVWTRGKFPARYFWMA